MITQTCSCRSCGSTSIVKKGFTSGKNPRYLCKACGCTGVLQYKRAPLVEDKKKKILELVIECRTSLRKIEKLERVSRKTINKVIAEYNAREASSSSLLPAEADDVLEMDELCSHVYKRINKVWVWAIMCRRTRQIVAWRIGKRNNQTLQQMWESVPPGYAHCRSYSDHWRSYKSVLSEATHTCVGKETGETNHIERFWLTARQYMGRLVRKALSFSKKIERFEENFCAFVNWHNQKQKLDYGQ